ncbi:hypothetical protein Nepgr_006907 [Nepenthes gracilis]|uniref:Uncharacterized protein n=1 Tax=Nepenthes gracilis TaxID=150966 RepID=A0AAD3XHS1_NEPGR|nr:hypothetical protein Nepgr_006907 [Nepenthes gracilis]
MYPKRKDQVRQDEPYMLQPDASGLMGTSPSYHMPYHMPLHPAIICLTEWKEKMFCWQNVGIAARVQVCMHGRIQAGRR